jgi:glyoxylase-like metal-dependent hydrolase (beta-lactamase superfamily II)
MGFTEIAPAVYVLRYPVLDVNATLIVGEAVAVVVDTLSTESQASELLTEIRKVTPLPLVLVNTHHHFDHCFGNCALVSSSPGASVWAHEAAARALRDEGARWQRAWSDEYEARDPDLAREIAEVTIHPPDRTVHTESTMDIGGRVLELRHLGRGHTDGDLVVAIPDAATLLAGDLIEQGAPPSFGDSFPLDWPETVSDMLRLLSPDTTVVPGHGAPVDVDFVHAQHDELTHLAWLIREGHADGAAMESVAAKAPFGEQAIVAVRRGYAELGGRI